MLLNRHTVTVFRHNLVYFVVGRFSGLVPYFFPGVVSLLLFLVAPRRQPWQWLVVATLGLTVVTLLLLTPFTYSGGGGPVGNRYFLSFYPLFLPHPALRVTEVPSSRWPWARSSGEDRGELFLIVQAREHAKAGPCAGCRLS